MNWIGGARKRVKLQEEKQKQKVCNNFYNSINECVPNPYKALYVEMGTSMKVLLNKPTY